MEKSMKSKVVSPNGTILVIHTEERYPYSTEILMKSGFPVILLNMVFGLLPTTLYGTQLKYLRCSVAQIYSLIFGLCMIILSILFVPVLIMKDLSKVTGTGIAVMVIVRVTHVGGFILLLLRGHRVAKKMPRIWNQLGKLLQMAIIDVHGRKYHFIKRIVSCGRWGTFWYVVIMGITELDGFLYDFQTVIPNFYQFYHLELLGPLSNWNRYIITSAFIIWQFCSLSHVLVSMLVCYLIVAIQVCLRATNEQLMILFQVNNEAHPLLIRKRPLVKVSPESDQEDESIIVEKLNRVKDVMVVVADLTAAISSVWGITLIIEVLILIANMLVNMYYILIGILSKKSLDPESLGVDQQLNQNFIFNRWFDQTSTFLTEASIHSYFFYRLCCSCTDMVNEAAQSMQIMKTVPYQQYSRRVQETIQSLKSDLASTTVVLSASNYFQINKFLLASIAGALTTYIVVLLQFQAQETQTSNQANLHYY